MPTTAYEPDPTINAESQAAHRRFFAKTGIAPSRTRSLATESEAREQWERDPAGLSDSHLSALACVWTDDAGKAYAAREAARNPPPPLPVAAQKQGATRPQMPLVTVTPEQAEAMLHIALANAGPVEYDSDAVSKAHDRYCAFDWNDEKAEPITDRDIALLHTFSKEFALRACMRRAGHDWDRPETEAEAEYGNRPVRQKDLLRWIGDHWAFSHATVVDRLRDARIRLKAVETVTGSMVTKQIDPTAASEDPQSPRADVEELKRQVLELSQKVADVQEFAWKGVWQSAMTYRRGNFVTHRGSMFTCVSAISRGEIPGGTGTASRAWVLCVKRGKDGDRSRAENQHDQ